MNVIPKGSKKKRTAHVNAAPNLLFITDSFDINIKGTGAIPYFHVLIPYQMPPIASGTPIETQIMAIVESKSLIAIHQKKIMITPSTDHVRPR